VIFRSVTIALGDELMSSSCRSVRRGRENIRVERQAVGTLKYVGVSVVSTDAGETISAARRTVGARKHESLNRLYRRYSWRTLN
jgi:hypothetical protein